MKKIVLLLLVSATILSGCGWHYECINTRSYKLNEENTANVGSPLIQEGCFTAQWNPWGLQRALWRKTEYIDEGYTPIIKSELIYSGREGNTLHITYREYSWSGYAREPFFQQLFYDASSTKPIVFKHWEIKLLDSGNQDIKFKVTKEPIRIEPFYLATPQ